MPLNDIFSWISNELRCLESSSSCARAYGPWNNAQKGVEDHRGRNQEKPKDRDRDRDRDRERERERGRERDGDRAQSPWRYPRRDVRAAEVLEESESTPPKTTETAAPTGPGLSNGPRGPRNPSPRNGKGGQRSRTPSPGSEQGERRGWNPGGKGGRGKGGKGKGGQPPPSDPPPVPREVREDPSAPERCGGCGGPHLTRMCPTRCWRCGGQGHWAENCTKPPEELPPPRAPRKCWYCGDVRPRMSECPQNWA